MFICYKMMFLLQRGSSLQVFVDLYHGFFFLTKLKINLNQNMHRPNRHRGSNMTIFEDFGVHSSLFINVYFMFWTYWNFRIRNFVKHIYRLEQRFDSNVIHISYLCFSVLCILHWDFTRLICPYSFISKWITKCSSIIGMISLKI